MTIKLNEASVQKVIDAGANHWVKGDYDRYYIDVKDLVDYDFYKTGNVRRAYVDGERISNTQGTSLLYTKIFVENGELVSDSDELIELAMKKYGLEEAKEEAKEVVSEDADEEVSNDEAVDDGEKVMDAGKDTKTEKTLDVYLQGFGVTRYAVAKATNVLAKTLQRASEQEATEISVRVIVAIAEVLKKKPGQVLDDLIDLEMENNMTSEEAKLLLIQTLDECDATALVTVDDMSEDSEAIVAEIDLPSQETIRFAVNNSSDQAINRWDVLTDLAYAMDDYDHEEDGEFFPSQHEESQAVDAENIGLSERDAAYLSDLSSKIMKLRK